MPILLQLQKLPWKGDGGSKKKVSLCHFFGCPELRKIMMTQRYIVQELCESQGGRPGLSVLTSLLVSMDVKNYWTVLRHWSQLVPNMSPKKSVLGHPIARATSYCLFPDTFWLPASKNFFKVGSVKFENSLSPPSIVKKVRSGSKSSQGT